MPTISEFFGIIVRMYFNDHPPPHFHAYYGEAEAVYTIQTLEVLEGGLPRRAHNLVLEWASASRVATVIGGLRGFVGVDLVWHAERVSVLAIGLWALALVLIGVRAVFD